MNRFIPLVFLFLSGTLFLNAQNSVEVEIINFNSDKGVAMVGLYNSEDTFLEEEFRGKMLEITDRKVIFEFTDLPDGNYAISVFHDENEDGELNTNFIGIPKEDYGTSNNAPAKFGPPRWKDAKFELRNGQRAKQEISL